MGFHRRMGREVRQRLLWGGTAPIIRSLDQRGGRRGRGAEPVLDLEVLGSVGASPGACAVRCRVGIGRRSTTGSSGRRRR